MAVAKRKAVATKQEKPKLKEFVSYEPATYRLALADAVDHSAKAVNTVASGGVRLTQAQCAEVAHLPYAAVSTLARLGAIALEQGVAPNLPELKGKMMQAQLGPLRQAVAVLSADLSRYAHVPEDQVSAIRAACAEARTTPYVQPGEVDKRVRQIILQDASGREIAVTPLPSGGLARLIHQRIAGESEAWNITHQGDRRSYSWRRYAVLPYGGANPQNAGLHARDRGRPLLFSLPVANAGLRRALAIHFKGFQLAIPHTLLREYDAWRRRITVANEGTTPSNADLREKEIAMVKQMVAAVCADASKARDVLEAHRDDLPGKALTSARVDTTVRGLIEPEQRPRGWEAQASLRLRDLIFETRFRNRAGEEVFLGPDPASGTLWLDCIKEALQ